MSSNGFCLRDKHGNLIYAESQSLGISTNLEAEVTAVWKALMYCRQQGVTKVQVEIDSLILKNMIQRIWKIPWVIANKVEEIQELMQVIQAQIVHVYREANQLADYITNIAINSDEKHQFFHFTQLPIPARRILNLDKQQVPTIRIRSRRINHVRN